MIDESAYVFDLTWQAQCRVFANLKLLIRHNLNDLSRLRNVLWAFCWIRLHIGDFPRVYLSVGSTKPCEGMMRYIQSDAGALLGLRAVASQRKEVYA